MLIDWFTVGAQTLNFLILVWLLKRFLYKPILDAIDAREKRIAAELADAAAKQAAALKERDDFQRKNDDIERQRDALLIKATDEAKAERTRLLDEARQAADALRAKRQDLLLSEQKNLHDEIGRRTRAEVLAIARKALNDLAGASLEQRMVDVFVQRLQTLDGEGKTKFAEALKNATVPPLVRSAFALPPEQQTSIQAAVSQTFSAESKLRFETNPDIVSGIELSTDGQKIAWNIADYLGALEKSIDDLLKEKTVTKAAAPETTK